MLRHTNLKTTQPYTKLLDIQISADMEMLEKIIEKRLTRSNANMQCQLKLLIFATLLFKTGTYM